MFVSVEVNVPAKTTQSAPVQEVVHLGKGLLERITFRPPKGPNWEVYGRIRFREYLLWPNGADQWIPLEEHQVNFSPNWQGWDGTYDLTLEFCSPQARFEHNIVVDIELEENVTLIALIRDLIARGF